MKKRALITGLAGQDGSYLAELLLSKGYEVHGIVRYTTSGARVDNIKHILSDLKVYEGDIQDSSFIQKTVSKVKAHEIYNLGAQSHVGVSFDAPLQTLQATGMAPLYILEAIRQSGFNSKFYQASTSELFGNSETYPQTEQTPFTPRSPYGCAKLYAHSIVVNYRESYNMFNCCGILFNHESPRRGVQFVTRKIVKQAVEVLKNKRQFIELGNLDARRDWGHAADYVYGMYLMMQHSTPDDYVLATGIDYSVKDFLDIVLAKLNLDQSKVKINPMFLRPAEVNVLLGDPSKARSVLGWKPKYTFDMLVEEMVAEELKANV